MTTAITGDFPHMVRSNYSNTAYTIGSAGLMTTNDSNIWDQPTIDPNSWRIGHDLQELNINITEEVDKLAKTAAVKRRVVQVFIADTDERVPLEDALLYQGEPFFTDLMDDELYYEINVKELLDKHNEVRSKIEDEQLSSKDEKKYLKKIKIRYLTMTVVTIAEF